MPETDISFRTKLEYSVYQFLVFLLQIEELVGLIGKSLDEQFEQATKKYEEIDLDQDQLSKVNKVKDLLDSSMKGVVNSEAIDFDIHKSLPMEDLSGFFSEYNLRKTRQTFLSEMMLSYLITYMEAFYKDLVYEILLYRSDVLKSSQTITYEEILKYDSKESLVEALAYRETHDLGYGSIEDFAKYFEKKFKIKSSEFHNWNDIKEFFYRRNLIIHNKSITNDIYCKKTGYENENEFLNTDFKYISNAIRIIREYMSFLSYGTAEKFDFKIFDPDEPDKS